MINLLEIEFWFRFSLLRKMVYMTFSLVRPLLSSPSIFSLSSLSSQPFSLSLSFCPTTVTKMADSPETAQHFIFMCDTDLTLTEFSSNHTPCPKQHPACFCWCAPLFLVLCIAILSSSFQPFVRHVDPDFPALTNQLRRHCCLGLDHEFQPRVALHMESCMDPGQDRLPVLPVRQYSFCFHVSPSSSISRYWVLAVGPFLLYCFVNDHSLELCLKIYKVGVHYCPCRNLRPLTPPRYPSRLLCGTS